MKKERYRSACKLECDLRHCKLTYAIVSSNAHGGAKSIPMAHLSIPLSIFFKISSETIGPIKFKFDKENSKAEERIFFPNGLGGMTKVATTPINGGGIV